MVYITGDIHSDQFRFTEEYFPNEPNLSKDDVIIVCGDFGMVWYNDNDYTGRKSDNAKLDNLSARPYKILFCDGNHENFNEIYKYPVVQIFGGKVHKIRDNIYHLMRGEIYCIEGEKYFVMGGAYSIDKYMRQKNISWWEQELPSNEEYKNAIENLKRVEYKVDYIISHTAPSEIIRRLGYYPDAHDEELTGFFDWVMLETNFKKWFFGHWHKDETIEFSFKGNNKYFRGVYWDVINVK